MDKIENKLIRIEQPKILQYWNQKELLKEYVYSAKIIGVCGTKKPLNKSNALSI